MKSRQPLTETDYLNRAERSRLALATTLKPLTLALGNLPDGEQSTAYYMLSNGLQTLYPDVVDNVGIMPALLPEMGGLQGVQAQLNQTLAPEHRSAFAAARFSEVEAIAPAAPAHAHQLGSSSQVGSNTRLGAIDVAAVPASASNINEAGDRFDWQLVFALITDQNEYPAVVVIGPQGTGKTTLIEYLLSILNRDKIVLDPHYEIGAWPGCRVIGAAMNYPAVSEALANISADVAERYQQRATCKGYRPKPVTLVLEEQTNWAGKVDGAGKFLKESLSDVRKVGYQTISVAHSDTNTARGGAAGTAKMRKQGELKITLLEKGLAEVSLKDREVFRLRYPDPSPYTVATGEPVVVADGSLGPGYVGSDTPSKEPPTIDVNSSAVNNAVNAAAHTQQATARFTAPVTAEVMAPANRWDKFREQTADYEHLIALANWLERREGKAFSVRSLKKDKTVAQAFADANADIAAGLGTFTRYSFIAKTGDGEYLVSLP